MAKKALIQKSAKLPKFSSRSHNRCKICGRPNGILSAEEMRVILLQSIIARQKAYYNANSWRKFNDKDFALAIDIIHDFVSNNS